MEKSKSTISTWQIWLAPAIQITKLSEVYGGLFKRQEEEDILISLVLNPHLVAHLLVIY